MGEVWATNLFFVAREDRFVGSIHYIPLLSGENQTSGHGFDRVLSVKNV